MKIVFLDASTLGKDANLEIFKEFGDFVSYETSTHEEAIQRAKDADIILTNKVLIDKELMDLCPKLRYVGLAATGMNNVDLEYAKQKNIEVKNVAGYSTKSVAQFTFMQVLSLLGKSQKYDAWVKSGEWIKSKIFTNLDHPTFDIDGKKWGIIGLGSIGKEVAKIAEVFGCEVLYHSTSGKNTNQPYKQVSLEELLKTCDILSVHCPLNEQTNNLIDTKELALLKQDAIIANVARGGIVNEKALSEAVKNEKLYAVIDVLAKEPMQKESAYVDVFKSDRILFAPHIAWASTEARARLVDGMVKNIKEFIGE